MKAVLENPGITIEAEVNNHVLTYTVRNQTDEVTNKLRNAVSDRDTGLSLMSVKGPNYSSNKQRFCVRGSDKTRDNQQVEVIFDSPQEATAALLSIQKMLDEIAPKTPMLPDHPGGTTAARMALITRSQANILSLTGKKYYPDERRWPKKAVEPHQIPCNIHYSEHMGQLIDILNKWSTGKDNCRTAADIVNPHKVSASAAEYAVNAVRELFDEAEAQGDGELVALWRILSGLRAPDVDENGDGRQ